MNLAIVTLYFGKLPALFPFWLKSCKYNEDVTFILITNSNKPAELPSNVKYYYSTPEDFESRVKEKLNIECRLDGRVYKTCDYRPLFGIIYNDYLSEYEYIGQCELDMIFGKLSHFLNDDLLHQYQKLFDYGHLKKKKNNYFVFNHLDTEFGNSYTYRKLLEKQELCNCDEQFHDYSINTLFDELGVPIYETANDRIGDVAQEHYRFILWDHSSRKTFEDKNCKMIFSWNAGNLNGMILRNNNLQKKEFVYIHLQKRQMTFNVDSDADKYLIVPNSFERYQEITKEYVIEHSKANFFYPQFYKTHMNGIKLRVNRLVSHDNLTWEVGSYKKKK